MSIVTKQELGDAIFNDPKSPVPSLIDSLLFALAGKVNQQEVAALLATIKTEVDVVYNDLDGTTEREARQEQAEYDDYVASVLHAAAA